MEIVISAAKTKKYATPSSGDTVEVVERPNGGVSVVMADGQSSGHGAKTISTMVVRKVISLLAEGVRDGAAARAASDYLYTERKGKVSSTLNILSVDKQTSTLVITRNNPIPAILAVYDEINLLSEESIPIGLYRDTRPSICEVNLNPGLTAIMYTDGLTHAGSRTGQSLDITTLIQALLDEENPSAQEISDILLEQALLLDAGRPTDDISVVVLRVMNTTGDNIRRMTVRLPIDT